MKSLLVILDFDGLLINSYELVRRTFKSFDLDVGDEDRFKNRRKFLKYFGGGKELLGNLVNIALPKKKQIRQQLTRNYQKHGRVFDEFTPYINACIHSNEIHIGIVSRNYALTPGGTIRKVLENSHVHEQDLDFVIPIPVGAKKTDVLSAMVSSRYKLCLFAGDEVSDYNAAIATGYMPLMASYGFDHKKRLKKLTDVPKADIYDSPAALVERLTDLSLPYLSGDQ